MLFEKKNGLTALRAGKSLGFKGVFSISFLSFAALFFFEFSGFAFFRRVLSSIFSVIDYLQPPPSSEHTDTPCGNHTYTRFTHSIHIYPYKTAVWRSIRLKGFFGGITASL